MVYPAQRRLRQAFLDNVVVIVMVIAFGFFHFLKIDIRMEMVIIFFKTILQISFVLHTLLVESSSINLMHFEQENKRETILNVCFYLLIVPLLQMLPLCSTSLLSSSR